MPLPDPAHRCDPNSMQEEYKVPDVPPLTEAQKDIIKSTAPVLEKHGVTITTHFCKLSCDFASHIQWLTVDQTRT